MEKYEIQKLRDLPIEGVAEQLGMVVKRHKALCPFHADHHASLSFNTKKNSCRCYVCMGDSVGTIDLVMKYLGKDFLSACRWLAEVNGVYLEDGRKREGAFSSLSSEASSAGGSHSEKDSGGSHSGDDSGGSHSGKDSGGSHSEKDSGGSHSGKDSGGSHSGKSSSFDASKYARFFEHPWLNEAARRFLFEERKIDWRVVNWCRLTSWTDKKGINWLQIPYFDMDGRLIGIQNRNLDYRKTPTDFTDASHAGEAKGVAAEKTPTDFTDDTDSPSHQTEGSLQTEGSHQTEGSLQTEGSHQTEPMAPRFRFPYGARCSIYNLPVVGRLKPGEKLFITEGCSDCWAMLSAGHKAIAIPSATLLKPEDKQLLADIERQYQVEFHMFPDQDAPGEQLFLQLREILPHLVHHQLPPGCKDFSEYYLFKFCK